MDIGISALPFQLNNAIDSIIDNSINNTFCEFISIILNTKGRVFFSAVGKPGYIARRVAATLASTGTPSFYIHPTEASHGDLGMITENDVVIAISNSGESRELVDIINYCKRFDIKLRKQI
jgi:arabinose-5-phosphate isomerase